MPGPAPPAGGVQVAVGEALGSEHLPDHDDRGAGDAGRAHLPGDVAERAPQHHLLRPTRKATTAVGVSAS